MKNMILAAAAASILGAWALEAAAQSSTFGDVARVTSATPIYERVSTPRRECRMEQVTMNEVRPIAPPPASAPAPSDSPAIGPGTVIGAIVGGVIGHQFGSSSGGRDHGAAAGAVIGGLVGNTVDRDAARAAQDAPPPAAVERVPVTREVQRCTDVMDSRDVVVGYDVRYEYSGREFRARMPQDPGPQMPVNVEVHPPLAPPAARATPDGPRPPVYRGS
jgi:uncharacterized protein YcfJ